MKDLVMKRSLLFIIALIIILQACNRNPEKESNPVPDSLTQTGGVRNSSENKIQLDGELPARLSIPALFDEMDYQQATQCYLWGLPIVSMEKFKEVQEKIFGATPTDLVVYHSLEDRLGILTANATTPYILTFIDLAKTGPLVISMPPGRIAGGLSDCWQREIVSIGETGADKGNGGKYLLLPPGKIQIKAVGYFPILCPTSNIYLGLRALDPDPKITGLLIQGVHIYPYAKRANPPLSKIISPQGKPYFAIQPDGIEYWKTLDAIIQEETVEERDRFFMAWLDNLGIKKGESFNPTERQKKILIAAAERGKLMAIANSFDKRFADVKHWPDRKWDYVMIISDPSQKSMDYDEFFQRSSYFYEAFGYGKSMITKTPNQGQAYLGVYSDKDDQWLEGSVNYTLHIPANPPAVNFWSLTVYDDSTRCLIDNPQKRADLSSRQDLMKNSDGSFDLYFGPSAPRGNEKNWVQTIGGKHWFAYMRFYGPTENYFNKSWKMGDIEKLKPDAK
jgi:hypothetical protein